MKLAGDYFRRGLINSAVVFLISGLYAALLLAVATVEQSDAYPRLLRPLLFLLLGVLFNTMYGIAHEAMHRILFRHSWLNEVIGTAACLPLGMSFSLMRLTHLWHHQVNRSEKAHYPMDNVVLQAKHANVLYRLGWIFLVYLGGFYLLAVIAVIPACCLPKNILRRFGEIFCALAARHAWRIRVDLVCLLLISVAISTLVGGRSLIWHFFIPMIPFGILWSMFQNVYHYDTTVGAPARYNARNIPCARIVAAWLLNSNYHLTHHCFPGISWYKLPHIDPNCPEEVMARNNYVTGLVEGILRQFEGPVYSLIARSRGSR